MILAGVTALSLGIRSADADSIGGTVPNDFFTQLPGMSATLTAPNVPDAATPQSRTHAYVTQSGRGTWLFQSGQNGGDGTNG